MVYKDFEKIGLKLAHSHSLPHAFSDFLEMVTCTLSFFRMEEQYLEVVRKYKKEDVKLLADWFAVLLDASGGDGDGFVDILGEFFTIHITRGHNGQYFTPQPITDLMAQLVAPGPVFGQSINDPSCGSGRTLMSAARTAGKANRFYGADLDLRCVQMTAINMCINDLRGQVAHMNTLSLDFYKCYEVCSDPAMHNAPCIRVIPNEESVFYTNPDLIQKARAPVEKPKGFCFEPSAQLALFQRGQ